MIEEVLKGGDAANEVDEIYKVYVTKQFRVGTKIDVANHVARLSEDRIRAEFGRLGTLLGEVFEFLRLTDSQVASV